MFVSVKNSCVLENCFGCTDSDELMVSSCYSFPLLLSKNVDIYMTAYTVRSSWIIFLRLIYNAYIMLCVA